MRQLEFVDRVANWVEGNMRSARPRMHHPLAFALGNYAIGGQDIHFAVVTYARKPTYEEWDQCGWQGWQTQPRLTVASALANDEHDLFFRDITNPDRVMYDPIDEILTAQHVPVITPENPTQPQPMDALIPFDRNPEPGRLGNAALYITYVTSLV